jgi:hypothetical protein
MDFAAQMTEIEDLYNWWAYILEVSINESHYNYGESYACIRQRDRETAYDALASLRKKYFKLVAPRIMYSDIYHHINSFL